MDTCRWRRTLEQGGEDPQSTMYGRSIANLERNILDATTPPTTPVKPDPDMAYAWLCGTCRREFMIIVPV